MRELPIKIISLRFFENHDHLPPSRLIAEGRCARSSRHARRGCGGRERSQRLLTRARTNDLSRTRSRSGLTPRCWCQQRNAQALSRHGGQQARRTRATAYKREDTAQGMPDVRLNLWYLPPAFFSAGGPWVRPSPGIPCALCAVCEGRTDRKPRASCAARPRPHADRCLRCKSELSPAAVGRISTTASETLPAIRRHSGAPEGRARNP